MWPRPAVILLLLTVNSQIFARIIFSRLAFKDIHVHVLATLKFATRAWLTYISKCTRVISPFREGFISPFCEGFIFMRLGICEVSRKYNPRETNHIVFLLLFFCPHWMCGEGVVKPLVCCVVLGILSSLSYILLMKRELAALLYSCCVYLSYVSLPRSAPRGYSDNFIHT